MCEWSCYITATCVNVFKALVPIRLDLTCRIYGMMSGLSSGNGAAANGQARKQQQSTPAVDPEILGVDVQNDPWKQ